MKCQCDGRARDGDGDMMNDDDGDDEDYGYLSDDDRYYVLHMASHGAAFDTIWDTSVICIPAKLWN